jgi:hypothetical protein
LIVCSALAAACGGSNGDTSTTGGGATAGAGATAGISSAPHGGSSGVAGNRATDGGSSDVAGSSEAGTAGSGTAPTDEKFSFFVTSLKAMRELSASQDGFGGDLTFGETGVGAGLKGADKICTAIAEKSMAGNGKTWRAFLSVTRGEGGQPVDAISRVGAGAWYDRTGRLVAQNVTDLATERPTGADTAIATDLPNEDGVPNHAPDAAGEVDNHDVLTGTGEAGKLFSTDASFTCNDWTSAVGTTGTPHCGHSWPRMGGPSGGGGPGGPGGPGNTMMGSGNNWMSALNEAGCAPGAFIIEKGPPGANGTKSVGDGGGYGGIYCFALTP